MPSRPRHSRSTAPRLIALAVVILSITWSFFAFGGGVSFSTQPLRPGNRRLATPTAGTGTTAPTGGGEVLYGINRLDCNGIAEDGSAADRYWEFRIINPGVSYQYLEVWARTDSNVGCSAPADRGITGLAPVCAKVATFAYADVNASLPFQIPDVAMMAAVKSTPHRTTDDTSSKFSNDIASRPTTCSVGGSQDPINLYLSFLLVSDTAGTLAGGGTAYELIYATTYDLAGPDGPKIATGAGNTIIKMTWSTGTTIPPPNFLGYHAYCVPLGKASGDAGTDTATATDTATGTDTATAPDTAVADTADAAAETDPDAAVDTAVADTAVADTSVADTAASEGGVDAASSGPVPAPDGCGAGAMLPAGMVGGKLPPAELEKYRCGEQVGPAAGDLTVKDLENNRVYAVAIAGLDTYGNPGTLSNVVCETPRETVDFYDAFRDAGGTAGGGYCSYSPVGSLSALGALVVSALGLVARLVRRRRGSAR